MKSSSTSSSRSPMGIAELVSPRALSVKAACHHWFVIGQSANRVLPTIWPHSSNVWLVCDPRPTSSRGQGPWIGSWKSSLRRVIAPVNVRPRAPVSTTVRRPSSGICPAAIEQGRHPARVVDVDLGEPTVLHAEAARPVEDDGGARGVDELPAVGRILRDDRKAAVPEVRDGLERYAGIERSGQGERAGGPVGDRREQGAEVVGWRIEGVRSAHLLLLAIHRYLVQGGDRRR